MLFHLCYFLIYLLENPPRNAEDRSQRSKQFRYRDVGRAASKGVLTKLSNLNLLRLSFHNGRRKRCFFLFCSIDTGTK